MPYLRHDPIAMTDTAAIPVDPARLTTWTVDQYVAMVESGALLHNRVELIAGKIVDMSPISNPHAAGVSILADLLRDVPGRKLDVREEKHIKLSGLTSMPQPDIAVCKRDRYRYARRAPTAADIHLIVEVAKSSLDYDRTTKRELYAAAGIPEYWIVNLVDRQLERFLPDGEGKYPEDGVVYGEGARFEHALVGEVVVAEVLPMTTGERE